MAGTELRQSLDSEESRVFHLVGGVDSENRLLVKWQQPPFRHAFQILPETVFNYKLPPSASLF